MQRTTAFVVGFHITFGLPVAKKWKLPWFPLRYRGCEEASGQQGEPVRRGQLWQQRPALRCRLRPQGARGIPPEARGECEPAQCPGHDAPGSGHAEPTGGNHTDVEGARRAVEGTPLLCGNSEFHRVQLYIQYFLLFEVEAVPWRILVKGNNWPHLWQPAKHLIPDGRGFTHESSILSLLNYGRGASHYEALLPQPNARGQHATQNNLTT